MKKENEVEEKSNLHLYVLDYLGNDRPEGREFLSKICGMQ